jgi:hypothetical protein
MTALDELRRDVAAAVTRAEKTIEVYKMKEEVVRLQRETEERNRVEQIKFNQLKPYLEKLPQQISDAACKGLRKVIINVSRNDFNSRDDEWSVLSKSPTSTLIKFLTEMGIKAYPMENSTHPRFSLIVEF